MTVIVVGAGGHGQVVADILSAGERRGHQHRAIGYVDDNGPGHHPTTTGRPVLGTTEQLSTIPHDAIVVAIGDNRNRARVMRSLAARGETFVTVRHPSAIVSDDVVIGEGSMICAGAVVIAGCRIGRGVIVNTSATVDHHNVIGDYVHIAPGVHLGGEVAIGEGALVGIGAVVLPRVTIGAGAIVGGGAVVVRDVPAGAVVAGSPARLLRETSS